MLCLPYPTVNEIVESTVCFVLYASYCMPWMACCAILTHTQITLFVHSSAASALVLVSLQGASALLMLISESIPIKHNARTRSSSPGHSEDSDLTRMHEVHSDEERLKLCNKIPAAIEADPDCHQWQDSEAAAESNRILQFMRQCNVSTVQGLMRGKWYEKEDFRDRNGWEYCAKLGPVEQELRPVVPRNKVAAVHNHALINELVTAWMEPPK